MRDLSNSLNAAMYSISSSGETSPTGSGQHELAVSDDEQPDTIMMDAGTENVNERLENLAPEKIHSYFKLENLAPEKTQGYERSKVSDAPKLPKIPKKHSTTSHPEKTYASDILKIQQIHAFDCGSDQEISTT